MWDLFCSVVDNYGDIGVSWRLARVLAVERGVKVRLWVDDLAAFARIEPRIDASAAIQRVAGVEIRAWREPLPAVEPGEAVIEAFGCALPDAFLAAMAKRVPAPVWINLEYLTAEPWAAGCHGLPSPHPRLPLVKHFFFPGFDAGTGGLLRERGLPAERDAAQAVRAAGPLRVSLFAYPNAALVPLLEAWSGGAAPIECLVPAGPAVAGAEMLLGHPLREGDVARRGALAVHVLPFTDQPGYDRLLWGCDWNFVRGEDSFVRAQWAGRPLVWQAYPQAGGAQFAKLDAFIARYAAALSPSGQDAFANLMLAWNGAPQAPSVEAAWRGVAGCAAELRAHARTWSAALAGGPELAGALADFVRARVK